MRLSVRWFRTTGCRACNGRGHSRLSPAAWQQWVTAHSAAFTAHQRVQAAHQTGQATEADLAAAAQALEDQHLAAPDGHVCETCGGHGRRKLRRTVSPQRGGWRRARIRRYEPARPAEPAVPGVQQPLIE